jgi:hypothetical protein
LLDPRHFAFADDDSSSSTQPSRAGPWSVGGPDGHGAFRVMAVVAQLGFAAGHAARQMLVRGCDVGDLDVAALQAALKADGQSLDLSDYGEYLRGDRWVERTGCRVRFGAWRGPRPEA